MISVLVFCNTMAYLYICMYMYLLYLHEQVEENGLVKQFRKGILYKQISQDEGEEREVKESSGFRYFFRHGCKKLWYM